MIDDPELKALFQAESEERIAHLKEGLSELESQFAPEIVEGVLRDAHTIKSSARMLGLSTIERLTHQIEEIFDPVRKGKAKLGPDEFVKIYALLEQVQRKIFEEDDSESTESPPETQAQKLQKGPETIEAKESPAAQAPLPSPPLVKERAAPTPPAVKETPAETKASTRASSTQDVLGTPLFKSKEIVGLKQSAYQSSQNATIRVTKKQLTELMTQGGDLTVTKNRVTTFIDQLEELLSYTQKTIRTWSVYRLTEKDYAKVYAGVEEALNKIEKGLSKIRDNTYEDVYKLNSLTVSLVNRIRRLGLLPLKKIFDLFPKMVEELAQYLGKEVDFFIEGDDITVDKKILEEMKDPIVHILRNSISHGIESPEERERVGKPRRGRLVLKAIQITHTIIIEISDDGRGLHIDRIKQKALEKGLFTAEALQALPLSKVFSIIFLPGFSTASEVTNISGRGVGLDVVKSNVEEMQGTVHVESEQGHGCKFTIELPTNVLTAHVFLMKLGSEIYAIPIEAIEAVQLIDISRIFQIDKQDVILFENKPISITLLANLIGVKEEAKTTDESEFKKKNLHCLILNIRGKKLATIVDEIIDEQHIVLAPFSNLLHEIPIIAGTTTLKTGKVCIVIDPFALFKQLNLISTSSLTDLKLEVLKTREKRRILFVDDSYAFRLYGKRMLEEEGYEVVIAEDGEDALAKFAEGQFSAIVTDIQMPKMNGLVFTSKIRKEKNNYTIPIIAMTTLESEEDRRKIFDAGATAYIPKTSTYQKPLMEALRKLIQ